MKLSTSLLIVGLAALGAPMTAHADCAVFSPNGAACEAKSKLQPDFLKMAALREEARRTLLAQSQELQAQSSQPTDCKMVRPIDPTFASNMPVQTPDPTLRFPIKTVPVPSCGKADSDQRR
jgi:hypothetical protein